MVLKPLPSRNQIHLMAKPPLPIAERLAAHPRAQRSRGPELFHVTLQPILTLAMLPPEKHDTARSILVQRCATIDAWSFFAEFDHLRESDRTVTLRGRNTMTGAAELHEAIRSALTRDGFPLRPYRFHPHITLAYRPDGQGRETIDPLGWMVEEILLVESVVGETRHIELGRWRLKPRQGELFH